MRVTSNAAISLLRRRQSRQRHHQGQDGLENAASAVPAPGSRLVSSENADLVRRELSRLPEGQRSAIVLHCMEGVEFAEVAATMGVPIGTAKTWVRRGLELMRNRLAGSGCAWSIAILIGALHDLQAACGPPQPPAVAAWQELLHAPVSATVPAIPPDGATPMAQLALGMAAAAAVLVIALAC
jgi:hypothetical protein